MSYVLHNFTRNSQDFIFSFVGSNRARSDAFSLAVAAAIIENIPVVSETDDNYFALNHRIGLISKLGDLNELLRIDVDKIIDFSAKLYRFRQLQTGWTGYVNLISSEETAVYDFFGISKVFSPFDLTLIKEQGQQIVSDILKLKGLLLDLGFFKS